MKYLDELEDAKQAYNLFFSKDPFPEISPALLNSADIQDYVSKTGMICPFNPSKDNLKPASYSINFSGLYLYWDIVNGKRKKVKKQLNDNEYFILRRNSIAFLKLEPYIQLPIYIAARFNLHIRHVYKGLLLGTGPLVDPGYRGFLNIPIHNLTDEDYFIKKGDPIIWMEFTKLSHHYSFLADPIRNKREGTFFVFQEDKKDLNIEDLLHKANPNSQVISSLPKLISDYSEAFKESEKINKRTNELISRFSISIVLSIAGILIAIVGFYYNVYVVGNNSINNIRQSNDLMNKEHEKSMELKEEVLLYNARIDSLRRQNIFILNKLDSALNRIDNISQNED